MSAKKHQSDRKRSRPPEPKKNNLLKNNKLVLGVLISIILVFIAAAYVLMANNAGDAQDDNQDTDMSEGNPIALIETSMGSIRVELYEDLVPNTVTNFINLANDDFYENLVFHRVANLMPSEPNTHVIQGGGFNTGGNQKTSPFGTVDLEIHPDVRHVDGAIAMARTSDPNSATSQFYICDGIHSFLDDNYAAFGVVIEGMDVVRDIASVETTTKNGMQDWPVEDVIINSITIDN